MLKFYSSPADKDSEYYFTADLLAHGYTVNFCVANLTGFNEQAQAIGRCVLFQIIRED